MEHTLKRRVMRRVYGIWLIRKAGPLVAETAGILLLGFWGLQYVSPVHVLENAIAAADGLQAFVAFFVRSFQILSPASQFAMVSGFMVASLILRDIWNQTSRLARFRDFFLVHA